MSDESFLDEYLGPRRNTRSHDDGRDAFVALDSIVAMLDLRLKGGNRVAYPYATLMKATLDPSNGIVLHYPSEQVLLQGRRLEPLYKAITQHRVSSVRASGTRGDFGNDGAEPVVTEIRFDQRDG